MPPVNTRVQKCRLSRATLLDSTSHVLQANDWHKKAFWKLKNVIDGGRLTHRRLQCKCYRKNKNTQ